MLLRLSARGFLFAAVAGLVGCAPPTGQPEPARKIPLVGFLATGEVRPVHDEFRLGLEELGYIIGQNILVEYRYAGADPDRVEQLAAELVDLPVDVVVATDTRAIAAAKGATSSIPIIMVSSGDPVEAKFVLSLARPGENITGLTSLSAELGPKRLELLREILPSLAYLGVLRASADSVREREWQNIRAAAGAAGVRARELFVHTPEEIEPLFRDAVDDGVEAFMVFGDSILVQQRRQIFNLTERYRVPVMYEGAQRVMDGGLISYSPSLASRYRRSATYVHRVLNGANPAELPVEQPVQFELNVNLRTAEMLGIVIPQAVLARADLVVQ